MREVSRVFFFFCLSLPLGWDFFDFGFNDISSVIVVGCRYQLLHSVFALPWTCEYLPSDGYSWFKGPDESHEYNYKHSTFEAMVRATTCFIWKMSRVRVRSQLLVHLVATVTIGLVVSARCVATCEGGSRVPGLCLAQTPFSLPAPSSPQNFPSGGLSGSCFGPCHQLC